MKNDLNSLITEYILLIESDLPKRWNQLNVDLNQKEIYEVLSGQLARQITLTIQFVSNPNCWTYDLAPIILRSMADNYINFSWIINSPIDRAKKFIAYGLGQEKLIIEHRKNQIIEDGGDPEKDPLINFTEEWLNSQRYTFLTEVNFGSWSGINTRQMAEESNCLDFYNYVYTPFSAVVHNTWGHIAKYNLKISSNPLHKILKTPYISNHIDIYNIKLAAKYLDKLIRKFDSYFQIKEKVSSYEKFSFAFSKFEKAYNI